jgi:chemosensory pili system protein ChpA (sensor histidine kinase/response regulator)
MAEQVVGGLKWVKGEIAATLRRVRDRIEVYGSTGQVEGLSEAVEALLEVRGVLLALQIHQPARLAEEMQRLADAMADNRVDSHGESAEAMMLALIQLPNYLDRLEAGTEVQPLALWPTINDLRASRGAPPLSEAELLVPASVLAEDSDEQVPHEALDALGATFRKVRPHFHRNLVDWYRPETRADGVAKLAALLHQVHRYLKDGTLADLFRLAEAHAAGLQSGEVQADANARALVAHLDRVLKPLAAIPTEWPHADALALIDEYLNALAHAGIATPAVAELQARYGQTAGAELTPTAVEAVAGLATAILQEIEAAKEELDRFVRGARDDRTPLDELRVSLRTLAQTLDVADTGRLPARLRDLADGFGDLAMADAAEDVQRLEPLAAELLSIEAILQAYAEHRSPTDAPGAGAGVLAGELSVATLREAQAELIRIKESVQACEAPGARPAAFQEVPARLASVSGALQMLAHDAPAGLAEDIARLVHKRYLDAGRWPTPGELPHLAGALAALELYIERLAEHEPADDRLFEEADASLRALESVLGKAAPAAVATAPQPRPQEPSPEPTLPETESGSDVSTTLMEIFLEEAEEEIARIANELERWGTNPADQGAVATLRRAFHTLKGSGRLVGATRVGDLGQALEHLLDRVIEHSLSPHAGVIDLVRETALLLPDLVTSEAEGRPLDVTALLEQARALETGPETPVEREYASRQEPGEAPSDLVDLDSTLLRQTPGPVSIEQTAAESGSADTDWLDDWRDTPATMPTSGQQEPESVSDHASLFAADSELLEIFRAETQEHLDTLNDFIARASVADAIPDDPVVRALHTLTGSARMSGVDSIAEVTKPLELQLRAAQTAAEPISPDLLARLRRAAAGIEARAAEIPEVGSGASALAALARELAGPPAAQTPVPAFTETPDTAPLDEAQPEETPEIADLGDEWMRVEPKSAEPEAVELAEPESQPIDQPADVPTAAKASDDVATPEQTPGDEEAPLRAESSDVVEAPVDESSASIVAADETLSEPAPARPESEATDEAEAPAEPALVQATDEASVQIGVPPPAPEWAPEPEAEPSATQPRDDFDQAPADPELRTLFLEDAHDLLDGIDARIREWQFAPEEIGILEDINRMLHTLKGSARLTGISAIGNLSHALETRLITVKGAGGVDDTTLELAQKAADALSIQIDALEQGAPIPRASALVEALDRPPETAVGAGLASPQLAVMRPAQEPVPAEPAPAVIESSTRAAPGSPATAPAFAALVAERDGAGAAASAPQIRVRADLLNRLVDNAGEIGLYCARLSQRNGMLGFGLGELDQTVARLREQLRSLEIETETQILNRFEREGGRGDDGVGFDPLELDRFSTLQQLSRALAETVNDLVSLKELLGGYQRESADLLTQQARLADNLQDGLLRTRMVPFVQVVPRLHRLVRQTADNLGKSARLEVIGPEVELDRSILDRLVAPLEHLLRNAVDHGLETAEGREEAGKPAVGVITLALSREGNDVVIELTDDGRGLNLSAIRAKAIARGLLAPDAPLADSALTQFVFEPGFTTASRVTQISGRGVGLDVVGSEIRAANGTIALDSSPGRGARFTIRLPLTLAIIEAFLVSAGENIYAVPHTTIEGAARISRDDLAAVYRGKGRDFEYHGNAYRVVYLGGALDHRQEPELGERRWLPLLLTRVGDLRVALHVDSLIESSRIVVKPLGPQLAGVRWLSGGTILPDGGVALILDALALLRSGAIQDYLPPDVAATGASAAPTCVMIVDDSLTVRRVTARLLRRQNIEVLTAKDGVEALTLLDERRPDLMLLDIEMPRMDGYELTRHVRRSERLKDLPIIMITSRTGDKHREHAFSLGVNRYLGKPYQESVLLQEINALLAEQTL